MATKNTDITFKGDKTEIGGESLSVGDTCPSFTLCGQDMQDVSKEAFAGKTLLICAVPSLDTEVCDSEMRRLNKEAAEISDDVRVLAVSRDLPFAQKRWCADKESDQISALSDYKYRTFGEKFGCEWTGPMLLARALFVIDKDDKVTYVQYVDEISNEPDYDEAISALKEAAQ